MKKLFWISHPLFAVAIIGIVLAGASAVSAKIVTNVPPDISADDIKAVVVEDFEEDLSGWKVETTPKKFNTSDESKKKKDPVIVAEIKAVKGAPSDLKPERWSADNKGIKKEQVLGLHFQFKYPGYNSVTILPPQPIQFPGRVRGMSIWVQGRGKDYSLEAIVKDHTGLSHILKFGSLNFVGWKPLKVLVPTFIPQSTDSYPQTKTLRFEKFIVRSSPNEGSTTEGPEEVFFFFDQMKVLTESFEVNFDGQDLDKAFGGNGNTEKPKEDKQEGDKKKQ
ncbi:MAG TPA: flagellar filament outer layer protein FlaA [Spirochaetota bacterium]|nr:flagellar filament outer layer protein FlaA [Spirochaetota bacterium]